MHRLCPTSLAVALAAGLAIGAAPDAWAQPSSKPSSPRIPPHGSNDDQPRSKAPIAAVAKPSRPAKRKRLLVDAVVAVVNNAIILRSELVVRATPMLAGLKEIPNRRERARRRDKILSQVLQDMVDEELIVQAALKAKLTIKPKEIKRALDEIKKQNNLDDEGLRKALAMQGFTMAAYRKEMERQILRMRAITQLVRPKVTVTDDDVRARYDAMNRRSESVSDVRLHHILIALPPKPSDAQLTAAKAKAAQLVAKARTPGADFAKLAKAHSDDPQTKDDGGELGWIQRGSIATEWEAVVFGMSKGEVRGPISGPRGLHVFYVSDIKKNKLQTFAELKGKIRKELTRKAMDKQTRMWLEELRKAAHVEIKKL